MIKTLNHYPNGNNPSKTAEIMSKYRPIAPKPETPTNNSTSNDEGSSSLSQKIKQSPYLRNLWPQLQSRPTRTRKRGRALPSFKRQKPHVLGFCPPCHVTSPAKNLSLQSFSPSLPHVLPLPNHGVLLNCSLENTANTPSLITLPLLPCSPSSPSLVTHELDLMKVGREEGVELNLKMNTAAEIPEEKDLLKQLQGPNVSSNIIAPKPVRPIGSCINVGCINEEPNLAPLASAPRRAEEVEEEVESEPLPVVISDSNNKVRMVNSAYKEMVGEPECTWLGRLSCGTCRRISGEVTLHVGHSGIPISSNGFSCWVRIDWNAHGKKTSVNAFCDVIRSSCQSRNYLFTWRFHTRAKESISIRL